MTLTVAFSNFEIFFLIFRKDLCWSIPEKNLNVVFPLFFAVSRILLTDRKLALCFFTFVKNYSCNEEIVHIFKLYSCNIF